MLPNHSPLVVAEQFGTLATLYPNRIDLGLGRAPGTDMQTARALRRHMAQEDTFPQDVQELIHYLGDTPGAVQAIPGTGTNVPVWILGSSTFGAQLAAYLGLPYAFASHFAPTHLEEALEIYRRAMCIPSTAHCSIEPYRWMVRSMARPDGIQFNRRMKRPLRVPTLHLHGSLDPVMRTRSAAGSGEYVEAPYRWRLFDGLGHFPHEEDPVAFTTELVNWLKDPEPDR